MHNVTPMNADERRGESGPAAPAGAPVPTPASAPSAIRNPQSDIPDLLPCPFCGESVYSHNEGDDSLAAWICGCDNTDCWCQPKTSYEGTEALAIAAWNRRATEPPAPDPRKGTPMFLGTIAIDVSALEQWLLDNKNSGVAEILNERERQIHAKGHTAATDDDRRGDGSLARFAGYIAREQPMCALADHVLTKYADNRIHQLAIAGALIAAEIDRLTRLQQQKSGTFIQQLATGIENAGGRVKRVDATPPVERDRPIAPPRNTGPRPYA